MSGDFWSMGGYAFYVWGSWGTALVVIAWNLIAPRVERAAVLKRLRAAADDAETSA